MKPREYQEELERKSLAQGAALSANSKGRKRPEPKCDIRTDFQRDRDRIIHSKAFRRLKHKTQVFISPESDHYRTRLTHTLEVSQIARTIARALRLNEDLTEAIALGHDLGHTPFGHAGERALDKLVPGGFQHNLQSLRVVDRLEKDGMGLNLTWEVKDGIVNHRTECTPHTLEGKAVRLSDKIAYINHDIDDAIRAGIIKNSDIAEDIREALGSSHSRRINAMIIDTVSTSAETGDLKMSEKMAEATSALRDFMFKNVYSSQSSEREHKKAKHIVLGLYRYFVENTTEMSNEFVDLINSGETPEQSVCDYIACMTDRYAIKEYNGIFIPQAWRIY